MAHGMPGVLRPLYLLAVLQGLVASTGAIQVTVKGVTYDLTTASTKIDDTALQVFPWWGNKALAEALAAATKYQLGNSGVYGAHRNKWEGLRLSHATSF